ncbi:uncharacterized protein BCR38DRAFT_407319 [Pseudomassariella vexata]|uniref:Uncharacterized protein n=1 Tax=Pseudomassariella vexata TaxID=1141098 RepID=A0A1Y2E732_9PEZI|nr:uncharacterized protein BCR38DRAFT_407319 [Pseudomassariella vexata]ORY67339.1 hypothetical protein BCR38DRAFT_407319 [Pseudomassariella vexata]
MPHVRGMHDLGVVNQIAHDRRSWVCGNPIGREARLADHGSYKSGGNKKHQIIQARVTDRLVAAGIIDRGGEYKEKCSFYDVKHKVISYAMITSHKSHFLFEVTGKLAGGLLSQAAAEVIKQIGAASCWHSSGWKPVTRALERVIQCDMR